MLPYEQTPVNLQNGIMYIEGTSGSNNILLPGRSHPTEFLERKIKV